MALVEIELKALMLRGLDGDAASYRRALDLLSGFLRGLFRRKLGSGAADIEDLVQETLLAIHVKRDTFDRNLPFAPWAYGVARYKLIDHYRRQGARRAVPLEDASELFATDNPEEGAVRRDVAMLLARLPARQRQLLADVKLSGLSMEEAALRHGISVTAAKVSVHRGMKRLEQEVRDENH